MTKPNNGSSKRGSSSSNKKGKNKIPKQKSVIPNKNKYRVTRKRVSSSQREERQREAVRKFRIKEKNRFEDALTKLEKMKKQLSIINTAIDAVDGEIDMMKNLIQIQNLGQRLTASQEKAAQAGHPVPHAPHPDPSERERETEVPVWDLSDRLSSPGHLNRMVEILSQERKPSSEE
jgi:hypothetical protein